MMVLWYSVKKPGLPSNGQAMIIGGVLVQLKV